MAQLARLAEEMERLKRVAAYCCDEVTQRSLQFYQCDLCQEIERQNRAARCRKRRTLI